MSGCRLLVGPDVKKSKALSNQISALLTKSRALRDEEFSRQRVALQKAAQQIVGEVDPVEVLRHVVERAVAELLSNPRLATALEARLKK